MNFTLRLHASNASSSSPRNISKCDHNNFKYRKCSLTYDFHTTHQTHYSYPLVIQAELIIRVLPHFITFMILMTPEHRNMAEKQINVNTEMLRFTSDSWAT